MIKRILRLIAVIIIVAIILIAVVYLKEINHAYERVSGKSKIITSPYGDIEYTESGIGPDVLVIHGSGGGYDQGELVAQALLGNEFHRITLSRFGYLHSTFNEGATWDDQAHAYAYLLDQMGIEKVATVVISQGGPSALLFAVLYPERVSSLTLISCGVASSGAQEQSEANKKGDMLTTIYKYDLLYWGVTRLFKKQFMELMGASDKVIADLTPEQLVQINHLIDYMNPVAIRTEGVIFDNSATMPNERIAAIKAPTLIIHAKDDLLQLFHNAEYAASNIQGSKLIQYEKGGHLLLFIEGPGIKSAVCDHIIDHIDDN